MKPSIMDLDFYIVQSTVSNNAISKQEAEECLEYWNTYFNTGYYLFITPFKFTKDPKNGTFKICIPLWRRIICLTLVSSTLINTITNYWAFRLSYASQLESNALSVYFDFAKLLSGTASEVVFIYVFHFNATMFLKPLNELYKQGWNFLGDHEESSSNRKSAWVKKSRLITITVIACYGFLITFTVLEIVNYKKPTTFLQLIDPDQTFSWPVKWLIKCLSTFGLAVSLVMIFWINVGVTVTVLLMKYLVDIFCQFMDENENSSHVEQILHGYKNLNNLTESINEVASILFVSFILSSTPYYVSDVSKLFQLEPIELLEIALYMISFFAVLIGAANIPKKMVKVKLWLQEKRNYSLISPSELIVLLTDFTPCSSVGLGMNGTFTFDYNAFGTLCITILTFVIVAIQLKQPDGIK